MKSGVYWIYHQTTDRAVYVGSSRNVRRRIRSHQNLLQQGKHRNPFLQKVWQKHGAKQFAFLLLEQCSPEKLIEREQFWVDALSPRCNIALVVDNPMIGRGHTPETRSRISQAGIGRKHSEETKRELSEMMRGRKQSEETRQKLSLIRRGRKLSDEHKVKLRRPMAEETKQKISRANSGKTHSVEHNRKVSEAKRGKPATESHRQKNREAHMGMKPGPDTLRKKSEALRGKPWSPARRAAYLAHKADPAA